MYNVAVFMEDENFQESTFRPEGVDNRISQIVYVPGMPELTLESDNYGYGSSKLIWSVNSRKLSRFSAMATAAQQEVIERKILEGIGAGFRNGDNPELVIVPHYQTKMLHCSENKHNPQQNRRPLPCSKNKP